MITPDGMWSGTIRERLDMMFGPGADDKEENEKE